MNAGCDCPIRHGRQRHQLDLGRNRFKREPTRAIHIVDELHEANDMLPALLLGKIGGVHLAEDRLDVGAQCGDVSIRAPKILIDLSARLASKLRRQNAEIVEMIEAAADRDTDRDFLVLRPGEQIDQVERIDGLEHAINRKPDVRPRFA